MADAALKKHIDLLKKALCSDYRQMYREAGGILPFPFLTPGSKQYDDCLWDWDSWLSNIALRQILAQVNAQEEYEKALPYEQGCIQNFLSFGTKKGWIPISVYRSGQFNSIEPDDIYSTNMHKPCLAQHAAFLVRQDGGDAEWLREQFYYLQTFVNNYRDHHKHRCGIYFWQDDRAIGVDNDPCTAFRPPKSSGSIYLNCLMHKELEAMEYLCSCLGLTEVKENYTKWRAELGDAVREHCWDERDGFFYSVDFNLISKEESGDLHTGHPRDWDYLIQRIEVWSGFLAMWAGIATKQQAKRMVKEHFHNKKTFNAEYGIRTLSKMEKMYTIRASAGPSSWLGPIWGISNYMVFRGLVKYGFENEAREMAEKTITLFGRDIERFGALHEYYEPDTGEPILNRGFQNWNYLVLNMIAWREGGNAVEEF